MANGKKTRLLGLIKFQLSFYQGCWSIVKNDIIQLFDDFFRQRVDISRINYDIITLLPKNKDANRIQ